jgi:DNA polymerase III delta subunit
MNDFSLTAAVTVLTGENKLEIQERLLAARQQVDPTSLSTSVFENGKSELAEIQASVGSPGFFGSERLVICHSLMGNGTGRKRGSKKSDDGPDAYGCIASVAPGVRLILVEETISKPGERKLRSAWPDIEILTIDVPRGRALVDWTCRRASRYETSIDGATAARLVEALFPSSWRQRARRDDVPPDLVRLDTELRKLATAAGENSEITAELVSELIPSVDTLDIWGLSNAISERDPERAVRQLQSSLDNGQAPEMILGQLAAQFETFAIVAASRGIPIERVASQTGLTEGRLKQSARASRNYQRNELARALSEIRRIDFGSKQGILEIENGLMSLVADLARRTAR